LSLWYSDSTLNAVFLISKMRKANKQRKKISHTGWENKVRNEMRGMKMRIITCFGDRTRSVTFFMIVSVSRTRSLGPTTSWMFSTLLHLLVYSLTVAFCSIS